ncbi:RNA-directed DNA polymerase, eukaryota, reverse transcriptase zinc-binding domain protein [Tanacetum coccineum]
MGSITSLKYVLTQEHLDAICAKYFVPEEVHPQLPSSDATMHERPAGKVGMYTRFFDYANYRIPFSTFFVSVLTHFRIPFSQLSVFGSAKVSHFEILCRVCNIEPDVSLFRYFYTHNYKNGWFGFTKRPNVRACYSKNLDSVKNWNDHFFWVDEFVVPANARFKWFSGSNIVKDRAPTPSEYNVEHINTLIAHASPFLRFPEEFLCWVGISRNYLLNKDTYPRFEYEDGEGMDLNAFIRTADPRKIDQGIANETDLSDRRDSIHILEDLDKREISDIAQKARVKWLWKGMKTPNSFSQRLRKTKNNLLLKDSKELVDWIVDPITSDIFERSITNDEIKKALWDCCGESVLRVRHVIPKGCNSSFIALIPKVSNATLVMDFRPISLIGCQYKIIGKILANRLSKIFKVDFEKAFDSLKWDFLDLVMEKLGFGIKWLSWIKGCLHNVRASLLVNGSPTNEFEIFRGLRQGDHLSPFLFILAMEGLHAFIYVKIMAMANVIGCGAANFPFKYLGVPVAVIWLDALIGIPSFKSSMHRSSISPVVWYLLPLDSLNLKGIDLLLYVFEAWKWMFLSVLGGQPILEGTPRGGIEASHFADLKCRIGDVSLSDHNDAWNWSPNTTKGFSVASARSLVDSHILEVSPIATRWNGCIPIKVNIFLWKLLLNKLPSRVNLDRRGIDIPSILCPNCQEDVETVNHIFFTCEMASTLWS